jgi:hypothetical protein
MKECLIHGDVALPAHDEPAEIPQPGEGPFDFPPAPIAPQLPTVLQWGPHTVFPMGANQLNAAPGQPLTQRVRITGFVIDDTLGMLARPPRTVTGHGNRLQGRLQQRHFGWGRRVQEVSQRNTLAVDHHQPLRAFPPLGLADLGAPFFAGAKLPSAKASAQSSWPWASSWAKKARQALSHTPCSSQPRKRRQQVLGEGKRSGRSCQRAPVRKIQRMPSNTGRFGIGFGPPRREALGSGNNGAILVHCASVSSECFLAIQGPPFAAYYSGRRPRMQMPVAKGYETASSQKFPGF